MPRAYAHRCLRSTDRRTPGALLRRLLGGAGAIPGGGARLASIGLSGKASTYSRYPPTVTAWYSGSIGRFESLSLSGMPVVTLEPVLYVDGTKTSAPAIRWQYVALGLAGAAVVLWAITEAFADDLAEAIDNIPVEG